MRLSINCSLTIGLFGWEQAANAPRIDIPNNKRIFIFKTHTKKPGREIYQIAFSKGSSVLFKTGKISF
jgi:hypothetical protein